MKRTTRFAIDAHLIAISHWTSVGDEGQTPEFIAHCVKLARVESANAVARHAEWAVTQDDAEVYPQEALDNIEAACRDAEALAAIDAHADAIKLLVRK